MPISRRLSIPSFLLSDEIEQGEGTVEVPSLLPPSPAPTPELFTLNSDEATEIERLLKTIEWEKKREETAKSRVSWRAQGTQELDSNSDWFPPSYLMEFNTLTLKRDAETDTESSTGLSAVVESGPAPKRAKLGRS
jgi:hypothetical protein